MRIYLSPSNQPNNKYVVGNTTEKAQMEAVAAKVKAILDSQYNCETVMATLSMGIGSNERPAEAKNKRCDYYIAIHSNAVGGTPPCSATGAVAFYHPASTKTKELATAMVIELNSVCPIKSNRSSPVASGMTQFNGAGYGEIRSPMQKGVASMLVEVDFHDNTAAAQWIINNKDTIAAALVRAIVATLGITKKTTTQPPTPNQDPVKKLYRVQVGAFSEKSNADAMVTELKGKGYSPIIVMVDNEAQQPTTPTTPKPITEGATVKIKAAATKYATGQSIPSWVKAKNHTVAQVEPTKALLKEIYSWVNINDIEII